MMTKLLTDFDPSKLEVKREKNEKREKMNEKMRERETRPPSALTVASCINRCKCTPDIYQDRLRTNIKRKPLKTT